MKLISIIMLCLLCGVSILNGQVPLNPDPIWSYSYSSPRDIAFGDVNNDGYLDFAVVREGSAGAPEPNYIFMNRDGTLEAPPSWQSTDADYSIGCAFGDVDNDGDLDLAVGNYKFAGGRVKLYENEGGVMNPTPTWTATADGGVWVGWGDVDNDGDLDLAAVDLFYYPCVFYNNNGTLESTPSWRATDHNLDMAGAWLDVDNDGDLDLAVGNINWAIPLLRVYKNTGGVLENSASWGSILPNELIDACGLAVCDINGDGGLDVAVTEDMNDPKKNYAFMNLGGQLETDPSWISTDLHRSIRCMFGDVDGDGDLDLAAANHTEPAMLYLNNSGSLSLSPDWYSNVAGEWGVAFGDVDNQGLISTVDTLIGDGARNLFYLSIYPVHKLDTIKVNGVPVSTADYCFVRESGWFTLRNTPASGDTITVQYRYSIDMELAVGGAYLYDNENIGVEERNKLLTSNNLELKIHPNPTANFVSISYNLPSSGYVRLKIYDASGREVKSLVNGYKTNCLNCVKWNLKDDLMRKVPNGIYYANLRIGDLETWKKLIIVH
jgi:hypothetical protein